MSAFAACAHRTLRQIEPAESGIRVHQVDDLELRERPWVVDDWGLIRGLGLTTTAMPLLDGLLAVRINSSHVFTGTRVSLLLEHAPEGTLRCRAQVTEWGDEGRDVDWNSPTGTVLVSSGEWSRLDSPGAAPLLLEIRIHDIPMREGKCFHGVVEIPSQATVRGGASDSD